MVASTAIEPGYIYVIRAQFRRQPLPQMVKIGQTRNWRQRQRAHKRLHGDYRIVRVYRTKHFHAAEMVAHLMLKQWRHKHTDWFRVPPAVACEAVCRAIRYAGLHRGRIRLEPPIRWRWTANIPRGGAR